MRPVALVLAVALAGCTAVKEDDPTATTIESAPVTTLAPVPSITTTTLPPADLETVAVEAEEVAAFDQPTSLATRAGDDALYVAERAGRIRRVEITTTSRRRQGSTTPVTTQTFRPERTAVLDIADDVLADGDEQGLLGITFSTDGNRFYVAYTGADAFQHLDEYEMDAEGPDDGTRRELLVVPDVSPENNGGGLAFGPDGFLYWGMGDGGGEGDPADTGQDPGDLFGSLLRIDPDVAPEDREAGDAYAVPDGNPFRDGDGGAPEVWAYGLRDPRRFSFDRDTGDLWIADVGQDEAEEIDVLRPVDGGTGAGRGANLGWSDAEGDEPFDGRDPPEGAVAPLLAYDHGDGRCAITGGHVYRGTRVPELFGAYVYADRCEGEVRALVERDGEVLDDRALGVSVSQVVAFAEDPDGELYAVSLDGPIFRIVPADS